MLFMCVMLRIRAALVTLLCKCWFIIIIIIIILPL